MMKRKPVRKLKGPGAVVTGCKVCGALYPKELRRVGNVLTARPEMLSDTTWHKPGCPLRC